MKHNVKLAAIAVATLLLIGSSADTAQAQSRHGRIRFLNLYSDNATVGVALVGVEAVQKEIGLSDSLAKKVAEIADDLSAERRKLYEGLSREDRREKADELRKKSAELAGPAIREVYESLGDDQRKRWFQVLLQVRGAAVLPGEFIGRMLELSEEQIKILEDLTKEQRTKMTAIFRDNEGSREERMEKIVALVKETNKKRLAALNEKQRDSFKEMSGEKFELPEE